MKKWNAGIFCPPTLNRVKTMTIGTVVPTLIVGTTVSTMIVVTTIHMNSLNLGQFNLRVFLGQNEQKIILRHIADITIFRIEKDSAINQKWCHMQCCGSHFWRHLTLRGQNEDTPQIKKRKEIG